MVLLWFSLKVFDVGCEALSYIYGFLPLIAWVIAGSLKFAINYFRFGNEAVGRIGNGGFPSTHSTVVSSAVALIGFKLGIGNPVFSLGVAVLTITVIDATGIRRAVGKHAGILNQLTKESLRLRESQGHKWFEVLGGLVLGTCIALVANILG